MAAIPVSEENGAAGRGRAEAAILFEALVAGCTSTAAHLSIHNMVAWMIDHFGDPAQQARLLPALIAVQIFASYCPTGLAPAPMRWACGRGRADGEGYVLDCSKAFISGGGRSDLYLIMARTGSPGPKGISAFPVEGGRSGISFGVNEMNVPSPPPWRTCTTAGCRVPTGSAPRALDSRSPWRGSMVAGSTSLPARWVPRRPACI